MLFRPIRLIVLLTVAFAAGVLFERKQVSEACVLAQGIYIDVVCREAKDV